jgi:transcriptional regulator with XRE-family HTH domain
MSLQDTRTDRKDAAKASRTLRIEQLARRMREKRDAEGLTLEDVHAATGISAATLSRFERWRHAGEGNAAQRKPMPEPDAATLAAVSQWLGISLDSVLVGGPGEGLARVGEETPDVVEAYLRADRNLNPKAAQALNALFRAAYEQFAVQGPERQDGPPDSSGA